VDRFLLAGEDEVFRLGEADFFFPFALAFGLGEPDLEVDRGFRPGFPFGLGEEEEVLDLDFDFGLGEAEAFLAGEFDVSFFFSAFFLEGLVFERPRRTGEVDLAGRPRFVVPTVPAFLEFLVVLLGDFAVRPARLTGDLDRRSSPMSCFLCSLPSSVSLYDARTFSIIFFSSALRKPSLSCLLNTSSSGTSKLEIINLASA